MIFKYNGMLASVCSMFPLAALMPYVAVVLITHAFVWLALLFHVYVSCQCIIIVVVNTCCHSVLAGLADFPELLLVLERGTVLHKVVSSSKVVTRRFYLDPSHEFLLYYPSHKGFFCMNKAPEREYLGTSSWNFEFTSPVPVNFHLNVNLAEMLDIVFSLLAEKIISDLPPKKEQCYPIPPSLKIELTCTRVENGTIIGGQHIDNIVLGCFVQ